jgi:hypothetical protein
LTSSTAVSGNFNSQPLKIIPEILSVNKRTSGNFVRPDSVFTPVSLVASLKMVVPFSIADLIQVFL